LWLNTGRGSSAQWHTGSRTNKSEVLRRMAPTEPYVEVNPLDAAPFEALGMEEVRVVSRRGAITARLQVSPSVPAGQVFVPMHFAEVNRLTFPAFDPHSRQPSYKACAVRLEQPGARRARSSK
jgi:anaerobic selenocysteine-containing dehydrogenase